VILFGKTREVIVFKKLRFQNVFCPHENAKPAFSNSPGLKSVFEKLRYRDGLSVDGRPNTTMELKLRFQIPPAWCGLGLRKLFGAHLLSILLEFILRQIVSEMRSRFFKCAR